MIACIRAILPSRRVRWTMIVLAALALAMILAWFVAFLQPRFLLDFVADRSPRVLYYFPTDDKVVALTIDDGPNAEVTPAILSTLAEFDAHATFFLIGSRIPGNERLLDEMVASGHELANHMMTDDPSVLLSADRFSAELQEADDLITAHGPVQWFRPGSGWYTSRMLDRIELAGYRCCLASVYPRDPQIKSVDLISRYVLWKTFPGSIMVLHDGKPGRMQTVEVLRRVLSVLRDRGYRFVTVSELVSIPAGGSGEGP